MTGQETGQEPRESTGTSPVSRVWSAWPVDPVVFGEATCAARRFRGADATPSELAWAGRVDEALRGLDALDRARVDDWVAVHAASVVPEILEARLVAAWETRQALTAADTPAEAAEAIEAIEAVEAVEAVEVAGVGVGQVPAQLSIDDALTDDVSDGDGSGGRESGEAGLPAPGQELVGVGAGVDASDDAWDWGSW